MKKVNLLLCMLLLLSLSGYSQVKIYVAANGVKKNEGTVSKPLNDINEAVAKALTCTGKDVVIEIRAGVYNLEKTITINSGEYKLRSLTIRGYGNETVLITGAKKINPQWKTYQGKIVAAQLKFETAPDQLFMNGKSMPMARYPNYDSTARNFNGTAADAISDDRVRKWNNPAGGYIHALHSGEWGGLHYRITGKSADGKLQYEGGWQNNRPSPMHKKERFVENIFEELDAPGEWFYDINTATLYFYPPEKINIEKAKFTISRLTDLIHLTGSSSHPLKNITISNILFTQNSRSFMLTKEPLLRSDWTIYRGAAILLDGTENSTISNCSFTELGGNAIFLSNYNKNNRISNNQIDHIGASAVAFVGNSNAVRSPAFRYELSVPWNEMDFTPGPKSNEYPQYCFAEGNLIHHTGTVEKQSAGVQIEMAAHITVSHNSIYNTPRAGINIGDGCWGGHIIEYNDVFNTVLETGDHGAFNSWGRDRFWSPNRKIIDSIVAARPGIELLDVMDPIIIRNNRFQCDHGWDIDLDDGSSNYKIYNNVCLSGGIKLREGYHRTVTNNIIINNSFHPHVWLKNSGDEFMHNIVTTAYAPIQITDWGTKVDSNFFLLKNGLTAAQKLNIDANSVYGDAMFADVKNGNFKVDAASPAKATGFKNFDMNVGVTLPALKRIAQTPVINPLLTKAGETKGEQVEWLGAKFKNIETLGERSAAGLLNEKGALLVDIEPASIASKSNLQKGDVIIRMGKQDINSVSELLANYQQVKWKGSEEFTIVRNQAEVVVRIKFSK